MKGVVVALCAGVFGYADVKLPPHTRQKLGNGLSLTLIPKRDVPLISVRAVIRGGLDADPNGLAGLGSITAELLRRGAGSRTADQFSDELDQIGAELHTRVDNQAAAVSIEFVAKDADRALALFADALLRPVFPETEVKKALAERMDAAKAAKDEPSEANRLFFRSFFFGAGHPYGRPPDGDELTLARVSRDKIVAHHRQLYTARNTLLAAAGDFDSAEFSSRITRLLGSMAAGEAYQWREAAPFKHASSRLLLVDKPDATQTYFIISQPGIHRTHRDRTVLWLVNTLFGDRFTSMLNDELRINTGLTYGARSTVQTDRLTGALSISSFTKTETTVQAIDLALAVLERLRGKGIDAGSLASAKAYVKGIYPTEQLETSDQLVRAIADLELHGLGRGEIDDLFSRIDAVTPEEATAAARQYFGMENLQFCLTGQAEKIREAVAKYAPGNMKVIPITTPGLEVPR